MHYILLIVMSSAPFLPSTFTMTSFESSYACYQALGQAKRLWQTVNDKSKCIDLDKETLIQEKESELNQLKGKNQ